MTGRHSLADFQAGPAVFWEDITKIQVEPVLERPHAQYGILRAVLTMDDPNVTPHDKETSPPPEPMDIRTVMGHALDALQGLDEFKRTGEPTILMETTPDAYRDEALIALRGMIYGNLLSITRDTTIRDDFRQRDADPSGTAIYKGLLSGVIPVITIGQHIIRADLATSRRPMAVRRLTIMEAHETSAPAVLAAANAYSYQERFDAARYLGYVTIDPTVHDKVLRVANRWTAPNAGALWDLASYVMYGSVRGENSAERTADLEYCLRYLPMRREEG